MRSLCIDAAFQHVSNCHVVYSLEASNERTRDVLIAEHVETFNSRALAPLTTTEMINPKQKLHGSTPILLVLVDAHTIAFNRSPMLQADGQLDTFGSSYYDSFSNRISQSSFFSSLYRHGPASRVDKVYFRLEQLFQ